MNKKLIPVVLVIIVAGFGAYRWWLNQSEQATGDRITLYGNVDIREVHLAFTESDHIESILVQEGDKVERDQVLARLHRARLQASRDEARAMVSAQEQALARLVAGSRP